MVPVGRKGFLVAVWVIGTMFATSLARSAVRVVGDRVTEQPVAATDLVVAGENSSSTAGSESGTTTTIGPTQLGRSEGGQASFTCVDGEPVLLEASPNLGWERDMRAPDGEVWFDHEGDDSAIRARCENGVPVVEKDEDDYDEAYEDAVNSTTTDHAPWHVVPADHRWYAQVAVAEALVSALEALDPQYPGLDEEELAEAGIEP